VKGPLALAGIDIEALEEGLKLPGDLRRIRESHQDQAIVEIAGVPFPVQVKVLLPGVGDGEAVVTPGPATARIKMSAPNIRPGRKAEPEGMKSRVAFMGSSLL